MLQQAKPVVANLSNADKASLGTGEGSAHCRHASEYSNDNDMTQVLV